MTGSAQSDIAILEEAAEWFAVLSDCDVTAAQRARWQDWLRNSPENARAWARVEEIDRRFEHLPPKAAASALGAAARSRRRFLKSVLGVAVGAPALWTATRLPMGEWQADYRTAVGEISDLVLSDGTHLWLNTGTALNVRYGAAERRLELIAGEVAIETAPDDRSPPRPLWLETAAGSVRPLGTRFSVRDRGDGEIAVHVLSGRVALGLAGDAGTDRIVEAGQLATFTSTRATTPTPLAHDAFDWTRGVLRADGMRLGDFIAKLARYRRGYLGCAPEVADLRLVGTYPLGDTGRVLAAIEDALPVRVRSLTSWWVTVEAIRR